MNFIPHSASTLGPLEAAAAQEVVTRNFAGYGPQAEGLEDLFKRRTGCLHAFAVKSGHHALALAVRALDLPPASDIVLPVLTCPSVAAAVVGAGHRCRLVDVREDLTTDAALIGAGAAAIIAPHAYGAPVDVAALTKTGLPWIEDCATSPATEIVGKPAGTFGTIAIFSLGSTKYITGGGGGVLVTDNDSIAARVADLLDYDRAETIGDWSGEVPAALPGRLADLNAAVAKVQFERLSEFASRRRVIAGLYDEVLTRAPQVEVAPACSGHSYYRYIVKTASLSASLAAQLRECGIDARVSVNPWLDVPRFTGTEFLPGAFPIADRWREHLLSLPIYPRLQDADARFIAARLQDIASRA
ncbi:MAG: DegT/DnrJ/EryC1/StrS aminotransferase family protein [Chthoniobacter sp.]|nr:DegT/DnrJ/EryC1/StrS aminotransferase family protein [Chthoniobacter sp.]